MPVRIPQRSRLQLVDLLTIDGIECWDMAVFDSIPSRPDERPHEVKETDRIDLLAFDEYGEERLWFIIAVANNIEDIPVELTVGQVLRMPSEAFVRELLAQASRKGR